MRILKLLLALASLTTVSGETLECDYREVVYEIFDETIYACVAVNGDIFNFGPISIDSVTGQHSEGESDEDVDGFELSDVTYIKKFPRGLERNFRNLLYISVTAAGLEELNGDDLRPFPQLKYLRIKSNWLKRIPSDLFRHTPLLEVIDMSANQIKRIAPRAFSRLRKLRVLDLSWNDCTSMSSHTTKERARSMIRAIVQGECVHGKGQSQDQGQDHGMPTMPPEFSGADLGEGFALLGNFMETLANMQREMEEKMKNEKEELEKLQSQMKNLERFNAEVTTPSPDEDQMPDLKSLSDFFAIFQGLGQAFGAMAQEEQKQEED